MSPPVRSWDCDLVPSGSRVCYVIYCEARKTGDEQSDLGFESVHVAVIGSVPAGLRQLWHSPTAPLAEFPSSPISSSVPLIKMGELGEVTGRVERERMMLKPRLLDIGCKEAKVLD